MTDVMTGKEIVQKAFAYVDTISKESRKALTTEFNQKYKGTKFSMTSGILRQSMLDWFTRRDKNVRLSHEETNDSKLGEVRMTFQGETKRVRFKVHLNAAFSMNGDTTESPCYLKTLNVFVDPREFSLGT
jgi:hypothetical protein